MGTKIDPKKKKELMEDIKKTENTFPAVKDLSARITERRKDFLYMDDDYRTISVQEGLIRKFRKIIQNTTDIKVLDEMHNISSDQKYFALLHSARQYSDIIGDIVSQARKIIQNTKNPLILSADEKFRSLVYHIDAEYQREYDDYATDSIANLYEEMISGDRVEYFKLDVPAATAEPIDG